MITEEMREIVMLCITNFGLCYFHMWTVVYPFGGSYDHFKNPNSSFALYYFIILFFNLGGFFSSQIGAIYF